jgi:hypothetical protein
VVDGHPIILVVLVTPNLRIQDIPLAFLLTELSQTCIWFTVHQHTTEALAASAVVNLQNHIIEAQVV